MDRERGGSKIAWHTLAFVTCAFADGWWLIGGPVTKIAREDTHPKFYSRCPLPKCCGSSRERERGREGREKVCVGRRLTSC